MKKLSDYQGEEAIELWADLLEPITKILGDPEIAKVYKSGKPPFLIAKEILNLHGEEAINILTRIDPTPVNGLNAVTRIVEIFVEVKGSPELQGFLADAGQVKTMNESSGFATANTGDDVK